MKGTGYGAAIICLLNVSRESGHKKSTALTTVHDMKAQARGNIITMFLNGHRDRRTVHSQDETILYAMTTMCW